MNEFTLNIAPKEAGRYCIIFKAKDVSGNACKILNDSNKGSELLDDYRINVNVCDENGNIGSQFAEIEIPLIIKDSNFDMHNFEHRELDRKLRELRILEKRKRTLKAEDRYFIVPPIIQ